MEVLILPKIYSFQASYVCLLILSVCLRSKLARPFLLALCTSKQVCRSQARSAPVDLHSGLDNKYVDRAVMSYMAAMHLSSLALQVTLAASPRAC